MIDQKLSELCAAAGAKLSRLNTYASLIVAYLLTRGAFFYLDANGMLRRDQNKYLDWAATIIRTHQFPTDDQWQYPPLAGAMMVAVKSAGLGRLGFVLAALVCDALILLLLAWQLRGPRPNNAAWLYVLLGTLIGPILLARFDIVTALFAVAGLVWAARPLLSGAALGIGASLKLWPALLVFAHPRRQLPKAAAALIGAIVVVNGLLWLWAPNAFSFLRGQSERGLQVEAPAALPFLLVKDFGGPVTTKHAYGALQIVAAGTEAVGLAVTVLGLAVMAAIVLWRLLGRLEGTAGADIALALVLVMIATSRIGSPQYLIWAAAIAPVCLLDPRTRMKPIIVLVAATCLLATLVYPVFHESFLAGGVVGTSLQVLRVLTLVTATAWACARVFRGGASRGRPGAISTAGPQVR